MQTSNEIIKKHYLIANKEDKFTKTIEYSSRSIDIDAPSVRSHIESISDFGIGTSIVTLKFLYRKKEDTDVLLIHLSALYLNGGTIYNPKILVDTSIIFLADGEPIHCETVTAYDTEERFGFREITLIEIDLSNFIQLANAKTIEYRMTGSKGKFAESTLEKENLLIIKGFYNSLFDQEFQVAELTDGANEAILLEEKIAKEKEEKKKNSNQSVASKSTNSNCFIVTATMGDINHPVTNDFRRFRDEKLLNNFLGDLFIKFYYKVGPFFANMIDKNQKLRLLSLKFLINPLHKIIKNDNK